MVIDVYAWFFLCYYSQLKTEWAFQFFIIKNQRLQNKNKLIVIPKVKKTKNYNILFFTYLNNFDENDNLENLKQYFTDYKF